MKPTHNIQHYVLLLVLLLLPCDLVAGNREAEAEASVPDLSSPDPQVRLRTLFTLVDRDRIGFIPESALKPLLELAKDKDPKIRGWTMSALGMLGTKHLDQTKPVFLAALSEEADVAIYAAMALGELKVESSVGELAKLTEEADRTKRHYAASALALIKTDEAKAAFIKYVDNNLPELLKELDSPAKEPGDPAFLILRMRRGISLLGLDNTPQGKMVLDAWEKASQKE